ncbi:MAG: isopentenyl phosphate kinase [Acidobacteriota bacterium]|nr:isopentenyl phosphate kinase [Acidobacteriota bacterium]
MAAAATTADGAAPPLTLIKWGGSLITDKTSAETPRPEILQRLSEELATAVQKQPGAVILGHGSGSFGHVAARRHRLQGPLEDPLQRAGVAPVQCAAHRLHRLVVEALLAAGGRPYSYPAATALVAHEGEPEAVAGEALELALELGMIPVTGGDVVMDRRWGAAICSTEAVLEALIPVLRRPVTRILWLGETAGILDAQGSTVPTVTADNLDAVRSALGDPRGTDVTGGMNLRLATAWRLARRGIPSLIADGGEPGLLARALAGETVAGTWVE